MDPLSQGLLGAALSTSSSKRETLKVATICGALGGMAPDLDIFIRSQTDPLLMIEYHRHFTHSLAFIPIGGLLVALALYVFFRKRASFGLVYLFTTLGFATHGLLDASTSYGTRLLWPFSDYRVSWNIVSIIDPIFTFTLLIFLILALWRKSRKLMRIGLTLALCYLTLGFYHQQQAGDAIRELADQRGHHIERLWLNPTIGNHILWRSVYEATDGHYYIDAVHASYWKPIFIIEGTSITKIDKETIFPELAKESTQRDDIRRFAYFSKDFIYIHPQDPHLIADLRYGRLPNDLNALWAIRVNPQTPDAHVKFMNLRHFEDRHYQAFWLMLTGESEENQAVE